MNNNSKNIGHFLTYGLWQDALRLLNTQIEKQEANKHFKTLSMIYYKKLGGEVRKLESENFYNQNIANNLFYGLKDEFAIFPYVVPKSGLGLRNYKFLTYSIRAVYDAIGLYLLKVSDEFLKNYYAPMKNIRSYYGGNIYFENDSLVINKNNLYYVSYYRRFRNDVRKEINADGGSRIIIKVDIQNYYDEISIPTLLKLFEKYYKDSLLTNSKFDETTKDQIEFFFRFLANGGKGIPQSDNSLISSIIGYLYLVFGDLYIDSELKRNPEIVERYKIIRYVDDIYVSIKFQDNVNINDQKEYIESLGARISDILYYELGLRLNPKTRFFWLDNEKDLKDLKASLKKVSPEYYSGIDEVDDETLENKINNIFDELKNLKISSVDAETFRHELRDEILKEVFDKRVSQMLDSENNKKRIRYAFKEFDFNRVKEYPLPIIIIILKDLEVTNAFRKYLLGRDYLTTKDVDLMLTFLCQIDFQDVEILNKLKHYEPMSKIISKILLPNLSLVYPGYYKLSDTQILKLAEMPEAIEQIRHRVFNEQMGTYSVALNHLLNEFHAICIQLDKVDKHKDYDVNSVVNFLSKQGISHEISIGIRKLFDRRNTNQVSHPGSNNSAAWSVSKTEYDGYNNKVSDCLSVLIKSG